MPSPVPALLRPRRALSEAQSPPSDGSRFARYFLLAKTGRRRRIALMRRLPFYVLATCFAAALLDAQALVAAEVAPVSLRYTIAPGQTNAYNVQIEAQGEAGREAITGTIVVASRAVGSNYLGLTLRGQLRPKSLGGMQPMMGYRPGSPMPLSSYAYGFQPQDKELVIDDRGRIVREAGDQALPIPLGQLAVSLLQPFPTEATAGWETAEEVFVLDEPLLQGPAPAFLSQQGGMYYGGYYPGRGAQGVLAAQLKTHAKVTAVTPETITLQKTLSLDSRMLTGSEPRISASGEGRIEFDRALGLPKQIELDCKTLVVTENLSRRSLVSLRWQLLEGAEREKAIAPPPPQPLPLAQQAPLAPEEVSKLLQQLKSDDLGPRHIAAHKLSNSRVEPVTPELVAQMTTLASDSDESVRRSAVTFLANNGSKEQVPLLIKSLHDSDSSVRTAVAKGLGRIKDTRAVEPLVNMLASGQGDQPYYRSSRESAVAEALVRIGPAAETPVLALLKEKNIDTRIQACGILKQIGTRKALAPLKDLTTNPVKELSEAAAEACRAIQSRESS
jgi:hypothetical protein